MENCAAGGSDGRKLPFYMTFPFSENLSAEGENEQDMQRMAELYPPAARRLWPLVEDTCDRWEYDGSVMYARYPDRIWIRREAQRMGRTAAEEACRDGQKDAQAEAKILAELAELLLLQEMYRRRCRRRRVRGHFVY